MSTLLWTTANGIRQECRKQSLLCQHNFQDIWRRKARAKLEALTFDPQQQAALADLLSHPQSAALAEAVDLPLRREENSGLHERLQLELKNRKATPQE